MSAPEELGPAGRDLWEALGVESGPSMTLALEACRIADRLRQLDRLLIGEVDCWVDLTERVGAPSVLIINAPLAEARQQATTLAALLKALGAEGGASSKGGTGSVSDDLAARRTSRLAAASGSLPT